MVSSIYLTSLVPFLAFAVFPMPVLPNLHNQRLLSAVSYKPPHTFVHTALLSAHTPIARQNHYQCRFQSPLPLDALLGNVPMHPGVSSSSLIVLPLLLAPQCPLKTGDTYRFVHLPASYGQERQCRLHILPPDNFSLRGGTQKLYCFSLPSCSIRKFFPRLS